jgi:hypothetical protein
MFARLSTTLLYVLLVGTVFAAASPNPKASLASHQFLSLY